MLFFGGGDVPYKLVVKLCAGGVFIWIDPKHTNAKAKKTDDKPTYKA